VPHPLRARSPRLVNRRAGASVWAIESGQPRRRVSLAEAVAFAKVFDLTLDELMRPPSDIRASGEALDRLFRGTKQIREDLSRVLEKIKKSVAELPALSERAAPALEYLDLTAIHVPTDALQAELMEAAGLLVKIRDELAADPFWVAIAQEEHGE